MWFVVPTSESLRSSTNFGWLEFIVQLQYIPRLYQIFSLSNQIVKATGVVTQTAGAGAAYTLLLYMLASPVCYCSLTFSGARVFTIDGD